MVVAAAAAGALSAFGIQSFFPGSVPSLEAVRALGSDAAQFRLSSLNPIRGIYDEVARKITSGDTNGALKVGSPVKIGSSAPRWSGAVTWGAPKFELDKKAMDRAIAAGINARINQGYHRTQDLIQYGRNPMAWHGAPPH
jgi:hypothetical protein